jgi:hypothetical protein
LANSITDATAKIHAVLEPLSFEERHRVINAALILLGDQPAAQAYRAAPFQAGAEVEDETADTGGLPIAASRWLKKNGLTLEILENYFHFDDGKVEPIELPGDGKAKREKTINRYLMQGVAALLQSGNAAFDDAAARDQCTEFGCYDTANHGTFLKKFGNLITGSKSNGWKLTAPGLTAAAKLLQLPEN